jgi:predicted lipid-binding transport protein (Tim44 family)
MQRSVTPNMPQQANPGFGAANNRPSLLGGMARGLFIGGLFGLLFGGGMFGGGIGGFFGMLIQFFLIYLAIRFVWRMFAGGGISGGVATMGGPGMMGGLMGGAGLGAQPAAPPTRTQPGINITPADYQAFEQTLYGVQQAWSQHDIASMRMVCTPEMVSYFSEQLGEQTSQGVRNVVADVHLDQGDLSEAWSEQGRDYATVSMRFSMTDVTYDQTGRVVSGTPGQRVQAVEFWTFLRVPGGRWVLSAIQQAR